MDKLIARWSAKLSGRASYLFIHILITSVLYSIQGYRLHGVEVNHKESIVLLHGYYLSTLVVIGYWIYFKRFTLQMRLMMVPTWTIAIALASIFVSFILIKMVGADHQNSVETSGQLFARLYQDSCESHGVSFTLSLLPLCMFLMFHGSKLHQSTMEKSHHQLLTYAEQKRESERHQSCDVILLEDDLASANPILKLFNKIKLNCKHYENIEEAEQQFEANAESLKVIMIDIFVKVIDHDFPRTGLDWLRAINSKYPKGKRPFFLIVYTGHKEVIDEEILLMIDYVLPKPWQPRDFLQYLSDVGLFKLNK